MSFSNRIKQDVPSYPMDRRRTVHEIERIKGEKYMIFGQWLTQLHEHFVLRTFPREVFCRYPKKVAFDTKEGAKRFAKGFAESTNSPLQRPYICLCGRYHLTTMGHKKPFRKEARARGFQRREVPNV